MSKIFCEGCRHLEMTGRQESISIDGLVTDYPSRPTGKCLHNPKAIMTPLKKEWQFDNIDEKNKDNDCKGFELFESLLSRIFS